MSTGTLETQKVDTNQCVYKELQTLMQTSTLKPASYFMYLLLAFNTSCTRYIIRYASSFVVNHRLPLKLSPELNYIKCIWTRCERGHSFIRTSILLKLQMYLIWKWFPRCLRELLKLIIINYIFWSHRRAVRLLSRNISQFLLIFVPPSSRFSLHKHFSHINLQTIYY